VTVGFSRRTQLHGVSQLTIRNETVAACVIPCSIPKIVSYSAGLRAGRSGF
jgi:hypothetical protein